MDADFVLLYDSDCGFCLRCTTLFRRLDRHHRVSLLPLQDPQVREALGISLTQALQRIHGMVPSEGAESIAAGAEAINAALDAALGTRLFSRIYRLPVIGTIQEAGYATIARHRHRLGFGQPACQLPG